MNEMNKEELIEYFIKLLNKNEFLKEIISIEQMRDKLYSKIRDVDYDIETSGRSENGNCGMNIDGTISIGFNKRGITKRSRFCIYFS